MSLNKRRPSRMLVKVDRLCEGSRGPQVRSAKGRALRSDGGIRIIRDFVSFAVTWTLADATTQTSPGGRSGAWCALLLVLPHRHWADRGFGSAVPAAVRKGLHRNGS